MTTPSARPYFWMLCGSLAFAIMVALAHGLASTFDWQVIVLARCALQLIFAVALAVLAGVKLRIGAPATLWIRSIAGSVAMVGQFYAYTRRLPPSEVLTIVNMFPIWVALLSWPILRQPLSRATWLAVASGVLGVILMEAHLDGVSGEVPEGCLMPQTHLARENLTALLVVLGSSLATAIAMIALHRLQHIDARAIIVHFSAVALLFCLASFFLFERSVEVAGGPLGGWAWALLLGVGATAMIGQLFLTKAYAEGHAAKVSVVGLSQIVFAMVLDILVFKQPFSPATLLGIALVVVPTAWLMASRG